MTDLIVANIIREQIGSGAFAMMGAKNILGSEDSLQWKLGRVAKKISHVTVTLDENDTYTVRFDRVTRVAFGAKTGKWTGGVKMIAEFEGVYADMLHEIIQSNTGLCLSL